MPKPAFLDQQKPGTDYGTLKSLVSQCGPETRSGTQLSDEERRNLECFLAYKAVSQEDRQRFYTPDFKLHRAGFVHLAALRGRPGMSLEYEAMVNRYDEIEDVIVKGDRLWCVFTLRPNRWLTFTVSPARPRVAILLFLKCAFCDSREARLPRDGFSEKNSASAASSASR